MFDLEEKVLHHAACQLNAPRQQQPSHDEIAVPTIHLIEETSGYDIGVRKEKHSLLFCFAHIEAPKRGNHPGQRLHRDVALGLELLHGSRFRVVRRQI